MRIHQFVIAAVFIPLSIGAHAKDFYRIIKVGDDTQRLPYVQSTNQAAAQRINEFVFQESVGTAAPQTAQWTPPKEANGAPGTYAVDYHIRRNDAQVLAMNLSMEGCGAYCENFDFYYQFNAATGRSIGLQDVFTSKGIEQLSRRIAQLNIDKIKREIKQLKKIKPEYAEESLSVYESCLEFRVASLASPIDSEYTKFQIYPDSVRFFDERCSNHAMRGVDELGEFVNTFKSAQLKPYLTPYGRVLMGQTPARLQ
ncbi:MAG: hypothetical protein WAU37_09600 [Formosimonas sp.]